MFDVGEWRPVEFGDLRQFEYALVDVENDASAQDRLTAIETLKARGDAERSRVDPAMRWIVGETVVSG